MPSDSGRHDWFIPEFIGYECCRNCGIVRRADDENSPCKGIVRVGLRGLNRIGVDPDGEVTEETKVRN